MKPFVLIAILCAFFTAMSVGAAALASPASCRSVARMKQGERLRELVRHITRTRSRLKRTLENHRERCLKTMRNLERREELDQLSALLARAVRQRARLQELEEEYLRTADDVAETAHALRENECEMRIREQRGKVDTEMANEGSALSKAKQRYCR